MKTRKLLAIMLAVALLASFFTVPVLAEGEGEMLEVIGILEGPGEDGVTDDYLATLATRAQAALVDLRLDGTAADAESFDGEETFTDAADATDFWQPILEYLKATPEAGWNGYPDGSFDPTGTITGMEFTKVLVVDLGYVEGVDFEYADVMEFAATLGLTALAEKADEALTMGDIAAAIVEVLGTKTTAATDITLVSQLVLDGVVDATEAEAAGFVVEDPALLIVSVAPTATDEVTVEMSTDVPEGTAVTLKKGPSGYNVAAAIDGGTIVLTASYDLPAGDWTVTVGAESADFTIEEETATGFTFGTDVIYLVDDDSYMDLEVTLSNQYGDAMDMGMITYSIFNSENGWVFGPQVTTTLKIMSEGALAVEDSVYVFVYDPVSGESASHTYEVYAYPVLADLQIDGWAIYPDADPMPARLYPGQTGNVLYVTAWDQYGMPYVLTSADVDLSETYVDRVHVISSNDSVIYDEDITVNADGDLVFVASAAGFATITLIVPETSVIDQSEMIQVWDDSVLTELVVGGIVIPAEQVGMFAGESAEVDVTGLDQYGDAKDFTTSSDITFTVTNPTIVDSITVTDTNEITVVTADEGNAVVYVFLNGIMQGSFTLAVEEAAYPFKITAVDAAEAMQTGVSDTLEDADFTVEDQYGREIESPFAGDWTWVVEADTDEESVILTGGGVVLSTAGLDAGTDTFTAYLSTGGAKVLGNSLSFDVRNVAASEIDGLTFTLADDLMYTDYADGEFTGFVWGQTEDMYYIDVTVAGTADGLSVILLDANADGMPEIVDLITSSNDAVEVISGNTLFASASDATDTTIKVWMDGTAYDPQTLDLCIVAPDLAAIAVVDEDTFDDYDTSFTFTDQYGVTMSGTIVVDADSPDGLISGGYTIEGSYEDTDNWYYTIIKWDGSLSATFVEAKPS